MKLNALDISLKLESEGEAKNPRRNLPKVIRRVWIRICLFCTFARHLSHHMATELALHLQTLPESSSLVRSIPPASDFDADLANLGLLVPSTDSRLNLGSGTAASSPFVSLALFSLKEVLLTANAGHRYPRRRYQGSPFHRERRPAHEWYVHLPSVSI